MDALEEVNEESILGARIFDTHFLPEEWGGANQVNLLEDGRLGVLGHIAYRDENHLHYHSMSFLFDPETIRDVNSYLEPELPPVGIKKVWVLGQERL